MRFIKLPPLGLALCATAGCTTLAEPAAAVSERSAERTAVEFMDAFNSLDAARFDAFFADDVTMFFPSGPFPRARVVGKVAVTAAFHRVFDMARQRGTTRLSIQPLDLEVQDYGQFAVATFHLRGNGNIGRRSILLRRIAGRWLIVHFHASSLEEAPEAP